MTFGFRVCIAGLAFAVAACGYTHDPKTVFPQTWKASFVKIHSCQKSEDHTGPYNEVWISKAGLAAFKASKAIPQGTIFLKPQFKDAACTDFSVWTAMRKEAKGSFPTGGDYRYQTISVRGKLVQNGAPKFCTDCHENCDDYLCTDP
jgi:hypothetical protein